MIAVSLAAVELTGVLVHKSIVPARMTYSDLGMIVPFLFCLGTGMLVADPGRRALLGLLQGVLFLHVFSNHFSRTFRLGTDSEVMIVLAKCVVGLLSYAIFYTILTHALRQAFLKKPSSSNHCSQCGYDLRSLTEPRCPECGLRFEPNSQRTRRPPDAIP